MINRINALLWTIPLYTAFALLVVVASGNDSIKTSGRIASSPEAICPLPVGAGVPQMTLKTVDGKMFNVNAAIRKKPAIFIFYRGGWCPYCNMQLSQLRNIEQEVTDLGYQIFAISPDRPVKLAESLQKHNMNYLLLSDSKMAAAINFGIAFRLDEKTIKGYESYGIDLNEASGESHQLLPVPAVFVVGRDESIQFSYFNPDYKVRLDPDVLLAMAKAALDN
jgi:peroxiredoxin